MDIRVLELLTFPTFEKQTSYLPSIYFQKVQHFESVSHTYQILSASNIWDVYLSPILFNGGVVWFEVIGMDASHAPDAGTNKWTQKQDVYGSTD